MSELTKVQEARALESARYNIAVVGRTGVGKSELINYLFRKQVAESGIGKPVTKRGFTRQNFELEGIPGTLFDSWGLELDKSNDWIADLQDEMRKRGTDRPAEEWFHTIFFCIDACSTRIQDFEIAIIKQFIDEKYRVVVIFTKSDLASRRTIEKLKATVKQEVSIDVPCIPVCSKSEELAVGRTMPFGAAGVIRQIYEGFWLSITQRLPARCVTLMCREIAKWQESMVQYVEEEVRLFNRHEIIAYVDEEINKFVEDMRGGKMVDISEKEFTRTIAVFEKFERLLDRAAFSTHDVNLEVNLSVGLHSASSNVAVILKVAVFAAKPFAFYSIGSSLLGGIFLSVAAPIIIAAGAMYVAKHESEKFKQKMTIKINEIAELFKQQIRSTEPQIEAGLIKMLSTDTAKRLR